MKRRPDWPERLAAAVDGVRARPFAWGRHDCALFALDCLDAMTGACLAARFRRTYATPMEAAAVFGRGGLAAFAGGVAADAGLHPVPPAFAGRGDIALYPGHLGPTLGVVLGRSLASPGPRGLVLAPRRLIDQAWTVR